MNDEIIGEFVIESLEHLRDVEPLLLQMEEADAAEMDDMNSIFRAVHSIKGAAGFLGLGSIQRLAHVGETLLMRLRDGDLTYQQAMSDPLLRFVDELRVMLEALPETDSEFPEEVLAQIETLAEGGTVAQASCAPEPTPEVVAASSSSEGDSIYDLLETEGEVHDEELEIQRLLFGEVAIDLGFLDEQQVSTIIEDQEQEGPKRSFGSIGVELGLLIQEQVEAIRMEQTIRLAMAQQRAAIEEVRGLQSGGSSTKPKEAGPKQGGPTEGGPNEEDAAEQAVQPTAKELPEAGSKAPSQAKRNTDKRNETVRVNVALLDELMNLAGELVLGRNQLVQVLDSVEVPGLKRVLQGIDLVTSDLQEHIMHTRMQPMSVVFDRLPRMVRDITQKLGKKVELVIEGKEVELDRSILEALGDPMTHLLRNSLDHGIELPAERAAICKPEKGVITVRAYHQGGQIVVEILDDGKGIDPAKLRQVAIDRGLYDEATAAAITDKEAINLIFHAGLSTADEVTDISGRGVGMDVVRSNIQGLGGQIELESTVGVGTTLRISLPLTLAIIPSLTVSAAGERYVLPQVNLVEIVRMRRAELKDKIEMLREVEVLRIRGNLLPLVRLDKTLGLDSEHGSETASVVVLRSGSKEYGLVVDQLHDNEEIVVKPLSSFVKSCSWFAGATILGDGSVAMILDASGLLTKSGIRLEVIEEALQRGDPGDLEDGGLESRSLLLFGNGEEEQFALPLSEVLRLERITDENIERVGHMEFVQHRGRSIPLVRLESVLPVQPPTGMEQELFLLIPRSKKIEAGIVATRIIDTIESSAVPDPGQVQRPGLLGSSILNGKMTLFLSTDELLASAGLMENV